MNFIFLFLIKTLDNHGNICNITNECHPPFLSVIRPEIHHTTHPSDILEMFKKNCASTMY